MRWKTVVVWLCYLTFTASDKLPNPYDVLGGYLPPSNSFGDSEPRDTFQDLSFGLPSFSDSNNDEGSIPLSIDDSEEEPTDFAGSSFESLKLNSHDPKEEDSQTSQSSELPDDRSDDKVKILTTSFVQKTPKESYEQPTPSYKLPTSTNEAKKPLAESRHEPHGGICILANPYVQQTTKQIQQVPGESIEVKEIQQTYRKPQDSYIPPDESQKVIENKQTYVQPEEAYIPPDESKKVIEIKQTYVQPEEKYIPPDESQRVIEIKQTYSQPEESYIPPDESQKIFDIKQTYVQPEEAYIPPFESEKVLEIKKENILPIYNIPDDNDETRDIQKTNIILEKSADTPDFVNQEPEETYEIPKQLYDFPGKSTHFTSKEDETGSDFTVSKPSTYKLPGLVQTHKSSQDILQVPELLKEREFHIKAFSSRERQESIENQGTQTLSLSGDSRDDDDDVNRAFFALPSHQSIPARDRQNTVYETPDLSDGNESESSLFFRLPTAGHNKLAPESLEETRISFHSSGTYKIPQPTYDVQEPLHMAPKLNYEKPKHTFVTRQKAYSGSSQAVITDTGTKANLGASFFRAPQLSYNFPKSSPKSTDNSNIDSSESDDEILKSPFAFVNPTVQFSLGDVGDDFDVDSEDRSDDRFRVGSTTFYVEDDDGHGDDDSDDTESAFRGEGRDHDRDDDKSDDDADDGFGDRGFDVDENSSFQLNTATNFFRAPNVAYKIPQNTHISQPQRFEDSHKDRDPTQPIESADDFQRQFLPFTKSKHSTIKSSEGGKRQYVAQNSQIPHSYQEDTSKFPNVKSSEVSSENHNFFKIPTLFFGGRKSVGESVVKPKITKTSVVEPESLELNDHQEDSRNLPSHFSNTYPTQFQPSKPPRNEIALNATAFKFTDSDNRGDYNPTPQRSPFRKSSKKLPNKPQRKIPAHFSLNAKEDSQEDARSLSPEKNYSKEKPSDIKSFQFALDTKEPLSDVDSDRSDSDKKYSITTQSTFSERKPARFPSLFSFQGSDASREESRPLPPGRDYSSPSKSHQRNQQTSHFTINVKQPSSEERELSKHKNGFSGPLQLPSRGTKSRHFSVNVEQSSEEDLNPSKLRIDHGSGSQSTSFSSKHDSGETGRQRDPESRGSFSFPGNIRQPHKDTDDISEETPSSSFFTIPQVTYGSSRYQDSKKNTEIQQLNKPSLISKSSSQNKFSRPTSQGRFDSGNPEIRKSKKPSAQLFPSQNRFFGPISQDSGEEDVGISQRKKPSAQLFPSQNRFFGPISQDNGEEDAVIRQSKKTSTIHKSPSQNRFFSPNSHDLLSNEPEKKYKVQSLKTKPQSKPKHNTPRKSHRLPKAEAGSLESPEVPSFFKVPHIQYQEKDDDPSTSHRQGSFNSPQKSVASPDINDKKPSQSSIDPSSNKNGKSAMKMMTPYNFEWQVNDEKTGNDFGQKAVSDGMVEKGSYHVMLPDGRKQIVTYLADWEEGFFADVTYEGVASSSPRSKRRVRRSPLFIL